MVGSLLSASGASCFVIYRVGCSLKLTVIFFVVCVWDFCVCGFLFVFFSFFLGVVHWLQEGFRVKYLGFVLHFCLDLSFFYDFEQST